MKECKVCGEPSTTNRGAACVGCQRSAHRNRTRNLPTPDLREWVYRRDHHACVECGSAEKLRVDHIVPVIHGGKTDPDNLQTLCERCNGGGGKGSRNLHGPMRKHLLSEPTMTVYRPLITKYGLANAVLLSECLRSPGEFAFIGKTFTLDQIIEIYGDEASTEIPRLMNAGVVTCLTFEDDPYVPCAPGCVRVSLEPTWATTNSTGRQEEVA